MTYCLGIITRSGLVMAADSRTNAGVDYISTYKKLFDFSLPGERVLFLCTSGNLSISQAAIAGLRRDLEQKTEINLHTLPTLYEIARYIGDKNRAIQDMDREWLKKDGIDAHCNYILGGQVKGEEPGLYLIYTQGNCIQATEETPFLQIGETKYGKPILDRTLSFETPLEDAAKCAILSIDSTMKSNISVGPPIHMVMYERDTFALRHQLRLRLGDPYLANMRKIWETSLKQAFEQMPDINWQHCPEASDEQILLDS